MQRGLSGFLQAWCLGLGRRRALCDVSHGLRRSGAPILVDSVQAKTVTGGAGQLGNVVVFGTAREDFREEWPLAMALATQVTLQYVVLNVRPIIRRCIPSQTQ